MKHQFCMFFFPWWFLHQDILREWVNRHAHLNEVGNFLIESTDSATSLALAAELCKVNMQWAEFVKRTRFVSD